MHRACTFYNNLVFIFIFISYCCKMVCHFKLKKHICTLIKTKILCVELYVRSN